MKKITIIIALVGCVALGNTAIGQDVPPPPPCKKEKKSDMTPDERAEKRTEKMKEELGLSDEQAVKVKELNMNHIQEMEQIRGEMKALRDRKKEMHKEHEGALTGVLTPEQKKIHDQKMAEHKAKREEFRKKKRGEE